MSPAVQVLCRSSSCPPCCPLPLLLLLTPGPAPPHTCLSVHAASGNAASMHSARSIIQADTVCGEERKQGADLFTSVQICCASQGQNLLRPQKHCPCYESAFTHIYIGIMTQSIVHSTSNLALVIIYMQIQAIRLYKSLSSKVASGSGLLKSNIKGVKSHVSSSS